MPMLRAVPSIMRAACSSLIAFKSAALTLTISMICDFVTLPPFALFGLPEPFWIPAAFFRRTAAGGLFSTKVKERSAYTVITTGIIIPDCACVAALNSLQNAIMLTPCEPSAGPIGGAGFAAPAGTCKRTMPVTFFAIFMVSLVNILSRVPTGTYEY